MKEIYELIPPDELHWCEGEKKFVCFSDLEYQGIVDGCLVSGIEETDDIVRVIRWAEEIKCGMLFIKGLISGRLQIRIDEDGEMLFTKREINET